MNQSKIGIWVGVGAFILSGAIVSQVRPSEAQLNDEDTSLRKITINRLEDVSSDLIVAQGGAGDETPSNFEDQLSGAELINALREGGHVIFFRHAQTEKDYADQINADVDDCSTQRTLSEAGWQDAKQIGEAFQELGIPVGQVYSSEYCRAWQTADLAFSSYEKKPGLNFAPAEDYTDAQIAQMKEGIMPLLTAIPARGTNTVVVGHDDVFEAATGIYPEPQGVAYILRPDGQGGFEILANVLPGEWQ